MKHILASCLLLFTCGQQSDLGQIKPEGLKQKEIVSKQEKNDAAVEAVDTLIEEERGEGPEMDTEGLVREEEAVLVTSTDSLAAPALKDSGLAVKTGTADSSKPNKKPLKEKADLNPQAAEKVQEVPNAISPDILKEYSRLMNIKPKSPSEINSFANEAYQVIKLGFVAHPKEMYELNEKVLVLIDDAAFHLFGCMFDFRNSKYTTVAVRVKRGLTKNTVVKSASLSLIKKNLDLYRVASLKAQNEKYPSEESRMEFVNSKNRFLLKYKYSDLKFPESNEAFDPIRYLEK